MTNYPFWYSGVPHAPLPSTIPAMPYRPKAKLTFYNNAWKYAHGYYLNPQQTSSYVILSPSQLHTLTSAAPPVTVWPPVLAPVPSAAPPTIVITATPVVSSDGVSAAVASTISQSSASYTPPITNIAAVQNANPGISAVQAVSYIETGSFAPAAVATTPATYNEQPITIQNGQLVFSTPAQVTIPGTMTASVGENSYVLPSYVPGTSPNGISVAILPTTETNLLQAGSQIAAIQAANPNITPTQALNYIAQGGAINLNSYVIPASAITTQQAISNTPTGQGGASYQQPTSTYQAPSNNSQVAPQATSTQTNTILAALAIAGILLLMGKKG